MSISAVVSSTLNFNFHNNISKNTIVYFLNFISFSAIIEHTNQVIFMEDDDLAVVRNGALTIHRAQHEVSGQSTIREIIELKIELQEIMKGFQIPFFF